MERMENEWFELFWVWKERDRVIDFELSLMVLLGKERDGFYGEFCKKM